MIKDVAQIAAIDPAAASRAPNEMVGLVLRAVAERLTDVLAARDHSDREASRRLGPCRPLQPKHAGRVPTGWALICHQPRIILKRRNPDHFVHSSIASGARHLRHLFDRSVRSTSVRAPFDARQRVIE